MATSSDLSRMYEVIYGEPPSSHTAADLLRMEEVFGITKDDPLFHMQLMQLRVVDQMGQALTEHTESADARLSKVKELSGHISRMVDLVDGSKWQQFERLIQAKPIHADQLGPVEIDSFRRASPLIAYLGCAFRRRTGMDDFDSRVIAARCDLSMLIAVVVIIAMVVWVCARPI